MEDSEDSSKIMISPKSDYLKLHHSKSDNSLDHSKLDELKPIDDPYPFENEILDKDENKQSVQSGMNTFNQHQTLGDMYSALQKNKNQK